jgi:hypothetical protein
MNIRLLLWVITENWQPEPKGQPSILCSEQDYFKAIKEKL